MVFVGAASAIFALTSHPPLRPIVQPGPLVVVGMPALSWADVSAVRTPAVWALAMRGAVATQPTRDSCSNQAWLSFAAGNPSHVGRSLGPPTPVAESGTCSGPLVPRQNADGTAAFSNWAPWRKQSLTNVVPSDIGLLASSLAAAKECITAAGQNAALGAANRGGVVANYSTNSADVDLNACPVTFIGLTEPDDTYVADLVSELPSDATIVLTGMADDSNPYTLVATVIAGPGVPHGVLTSMSTRQPGVLQTTDLSALVLARLGVKAPNLPEGRSPQVQPSADQTAPAAEVTELTDALNIEYPFVPRFFSLFFGGCALALAIGFLWWWIARRRYDDPSEMRLSRTLRGWFAIVGAMCASTPVATLISGLLPWWRSAHPQVALSLLIIGVSAALTALALLGPWRRWVAGPLTFLLAVTLFVIAQDVMHGSPLQFISLMGLQPVYGARFFGMGNVAYTVYAAAALLFAAVLANRLIAAGQRTLAVITVALIGIAAVVIDGYPSWGADGGGPVAMIPAFAYVTFHAADLSLTWKRLVATAGLTVTMVGAFAWIDYLRPPSNRTHLGNFVADLSGTGKLNGLGLIWTDNWAMLTSTWLNLSVVLLVFALVLFLIRPQLFNRLLRPALERVPFLAHGLAAISICLLIGFFSNDSGTVIPPTGLLVVIPLLILLAARPRQTAAPKNPE